MDWVRDPTALRTLVALRAMQVGDEIIERATLKNAMNYFGKEVPAILSNGNLEFVQTVFDNDDISTEYWTLVAWRRPSPKEKT